MKLCKKCNQVKSLDEFYDNPRIKKDGKNSYCKTCMAEYQKAYKTRLKTVSPEELQRARQAQQSDAHVEYIYLVSSQTFSGFIKLGRSTRPSSRLTVYNTHTPFRDFEFLRLYKVLNSRLAEEEFLRIFRSNQNSTSEWFRMTSCEAITLADKVYQQYRKQYEKNCIRHRNELDRQSHLVLCN